MQATPIFRFSSSENSLLFNQLTGQITTDLAAVLHQHALRLPSGAMLDNQPFHMKKYVEKSKLITCVKPLSSAVQWQGGTWPQAVISAALPALCKKISWIIDRFGCLLPPCLLLPSIPDRGFEMLIANFKWSIKGSLSYFDVLLMRSGASQSNFELYLGR